MPKEERWPVNTHPDSPIDPEALEAMRDRWRDCTKWAAYENQDLSSANRGHLQFLHVGGGCTYNEAPARMPDTSAGLGFRYYYIGDVDLDTGLIKKE